MNRNDVSIYTTRDQYSELLEYHLRTNTDDFYVSVMPDGSGVAIANKPAAQNPECVLVEPQDVDKLITVVGAAADSCRGFLWANSSADMG